MNELNELEVKEIIANSLQNRHDDHGLEQFENQTLVQLQKFFDKTYSIGSELNINECQYTIISNSYISNDRKLTVSVSVKDSNGDERQIHITDIKDGKVCTNSITHKN
jgi:hypothetical protein